MRTGMTTASEEVDNLILNLRDAQGQTFQAIAVRIGLSKKTIQIRYYKLVEADRELTSKVSALHRGGLASEAIARELGVHVVTVARWTGSRLDRGQTADPELQRRLRELVDRDRLSIASAARQLGIAKSVAWKCYRRAIGIEPQPSNRLNRADITTASILELRDRYHLSWRAIASRMNMSPSGVRRRYYSNSDPSCSSTVGSVGRSVSSNRHQEQLVVRLRDQGMTFEAVASQIGRTVSAVRAVYNSAVDADLHRINRARELSATGLTDCEIASQLHVHEATVARWTGNLRRGRPPQAALNRRIVEMRDKKRMDFEGISRELGLSQPDVRRRYRTETDKEERRISEARVLHRAGGPIADIAANLGAHEETIRRWTAARPTRGRPPRMDVSDETIQLLRDDQGLTYRAISVRTGLSESTVWRRYKRVTATPASSSVRSATRKLASP